MLTSSETYFLANKSRNCAKNEFSIFLQVNGGGRQVSVWTKHK